MDFIKGEELCLAYLAGVASKLACRNLGEVQVPLACCRSEKQNGSGGN